jgi:TP901 family phage tail tape measure protein
MADAVSSLIVRLIDQVTGPAKAIANSIGGISDAAKRASGTTITDTIHAAMTRNSKALASARAGMVEAIGVFYTLKRALQAPIESAAAMQASLNDIGIKSGATSAQLEQLRGSINEAARGGTQFATNVTKVASDLVNMNVSLEDTRRLLPDMSMAATALRAPLNDLGTTAVSVMQNMKILPQDMMNVWDMMGKAAKDGGMEVNDLAAALPKLMANYRTLGAEGARDIGSLIAALEALRNRSQNAEEATSRLDALMQKMSGTRGLAVQFKKVSVDLPKELEKGAKAGLAPLEALLAVFDKVEKSPAKFKKLMASLPVEIRSTIQALREQSAEFTKMRDDMVEAMGFTAEQYAKMQDTFEQRMKAFNVQWDIFKTGIGTALLKPLTDLLAALNPILSWCTDFAAKYPQVTAALVGGAAALAAFAASMAAIKWLGAFSWGGILSLADGITKLTGIGGLTASSGKLLLIGGAIGVVAAAIGLLAYLNWDEIVKGWNSFKENFTVSDATTANLNQIANAIERITDIDTSGLKAPEGAGESWGKYFADLLGGSRTAADEMGRTRPTAGWIEQFSAEVAKTASTTAKEIDGIKSVVSGLVGAWNDPIAAVEKYGAAVLASTGDISPATAQKLTTALVEAWNDPVAAAKKYSAEALSALTGIDSASATRVVNEIATAWANPAQAAKDYAAAALSAVTGIGTADATSAIDGLIDAWKRLADAPSAVFRTAEDEMGRTRPTTMGQALASQFKTIATGIKTELQAIWEDPSGKATEYSNRIAAALSAAGITQAVASLKTELASLWDDGEAKASQYATAIGAALASTGITGAVTSIQNELAAIWTDPAGKATEYGGRISAALASVQTAVSPVVAGIRTELEAIWADPAGKATQYASQIASAFQSIVPQMSAAGAAIIQALWDGMKSLVEGLISWVGGIASRIAAPFKGIAGAIRGAIGGASAEAAGAGGGAAAAPAPAPAAKAKGGAVLPNRPILVGEKRPEIWNPRTSGEIIPKVPNAVASKSVTLNPTFNLSFAGKVDELTVDQIRKVLRDEVHHAFRGVYGDTGQRFV